MSFVSFSALPWPKSSCSVPPAPKLEPAPVAQLDRASDYGSGGWGFESSRARHLFSENPSIPSSAKSVRAATDFALDGAALQELAVALLAVPKVAAHGGAADYVHGTVLAVDGGWLAR
jgi:hypothetical protein